MNRVSTIFLRFVICFIAVGALAVCIFALPNIAASDAEAHPELAYQQYPFLAYAYTLCVIFLFALYHAFKLLTYIGANKSFSELSVRSLRYIKYCAIAISALILIGEIILMVLSAGKGEDMTGIVMLGLIVIFVSSIGATIMAVLQRHVQKAIEIKSENDLTV